MKIINIEQNTEEWLELRRGKITGSKLKGIIVKRGTTRKIGFYEILAEKMGIPADGENPLDRGHRLEDEAIEQFVEKTGKKVEKVGFCVSDDNEDIALSPDGLIKDEADKYTEAVEIKCLASAKHLKSYFDQEIPSEYDEQVNQYFIVNDDLKVLHFVMYDPRVTAMPYFSIEIKREDIEEKIIAYKEYQIKTLAEINDCILKLTF